MRWLPVFKKSKTSSHSKASKAEERTDDMTNEPEKTETQPEGAAKLADPSKVKQIEVPNAEAPVEVDNSLANRGAPGQSTTPEKLLPPGGETPPPDMSKLPKDENGEPRDLNMQEAKDLKESVIAQLRTIFDPEIPVNIYELGLIYNISVGLKGDIHIRMTLTSPACPVAGTLPGEVEQKIRQLDVVTQAKVELVWDPQWNKSMMTEAAKLELNVM